jgi:5-methylcytosine-specific restriction endonuclease McrA
MANSTSYSEKLRHPKWQKKRLEILQRDNFTCQCCFDDDTELNVHHKKYIFGNEIWDYDDSVFITLCIDCHKDITESKRNIKNIIDDNFVTTDYIFELESILETIKSFDPYELTLVSNYLNKIKTNGKG